MQPTILLLLTGVLTTSALSGALGMGGGMLLMGLYVHLLPVPQAMVLHGVTQLAANGLRAYLLREGIRPAVLLPYLGGGFLAMLLAGALGHVPGRAGVLLLLGALPFLAPHLPFRFRLREEVPGDAVRCGLSVGLLHLSAGVSGPVLDLFFLDTPLDRHQVVATKAATQSLAHGAKLVYFSLAPGDGAAVLRPELVAAVWLASLLGTLLGKQLLGRMSEASFRRAGTLLVRGAGLVYLTRGLLLLVP